MKESKSPFIIIKQKFIEDPGEENSMTVLADLVKKYKWVEIEKKLNTLYPEQAKFLSWYKKKYWALYSISPQCLQENMEIEIEKISDGYADFFDINGKKENDPYFYGLECYPQELWLSFPISHETLQCFSEIDILSICFYEMHFVELYTTLSEN